MIWRYILHLFSIYMGLGLKPQARNRSMMYLSPSRVIGGTHASLIVSVALMVVGNHQRYVRDVYGVCKGSGDVGLLGWVCHDQNIAGED